MPRRRPRSSFSTGVSPTFPCPATLPSHPRDVPFRSECQLKIFLSAILRERERASFRGSWDRPARKASLSSLSLSLSLSHGGRERKGARLYPESDGPLRSLPALGLPKLEIPCRLIPPKFHGAAPQPRKLRGLVYSRACRRALRETAETADIPDEAPIPRQEVCQDTPRGSLLVTLDWRLHS